MTTNGWNKNKLNRARFTINQIPQKLPFVEKFDSRKNFIPMVTQPLHALVNSTPRNQPLRWTAELKKLLYSKQNCPITCHTTSFPGYNRCNIVVGQCERHTHKCRSSTSQRWFMCASRNLIERLDPRSTWVINIWPKTFCMFRSHEIFPIL